MQTPKIWNVETQVVAEAIHGEYKEWDELEDFAKNSEIVSIEQNPENKNIIVKVEAHTAAAAAAATEHAIATLSRKIGTLSVVTMHTTLDKNLDRPINNEPEFPKLVGRTLANHKNQGTHLYGLDVTNQPDFPNPAFRTISGNLWYNEEVEKWWQTNSSY